MEHVGMEHVVATRGMNMGGTKCPLNIAMNIWLVVEPTHLKNMLVKLEGFPK